MVEYIETPEPEVLVEDELESEEEAHRLRVQKVLGIVDESIFDSPVFIQSVSFDPEEASIEISWVERTTQGETMRSMNLDSLICSTEEEAVTWSVIQDAARNLIQELQYRKMQMRNGDG